MSKIRSPIASGILISLIALAYADLSLTQQVVTDDETANDQQREELDATPDLSPRQLRRAERRRLRELDVSDDPAFSSDRTETVNANRSEPDVVIVVEVEPEMECRRAAVTGSRVSREICTPVARLEATERQEEENAQEFLRRTRELSTVITEDERNNPPGLTPSAFD
jgi:hypothetical protein